MARVERLPDLLVLSESSPEQMTFRFDSTFWGWLAAIAGVASLAIGILLFRRGPAASSVLLGLFVLLLALLCFYSSVHSFTTIQSLVIDGRKHTVRNDAHTLYGHVAWERGADLFKEIVVRRAVTSTGDRANNWAIVLVGTDGRELFLAENAFGSLHHERAVDLAERVGRLAGIPVVDRDS